LIFAGSTSSLVLLAACQGGAAPAGPTQEPFVARTRVPLSVPQSTAAPAAAPAAPVAPATAPAVGKPEPKGKFSEAWQSTMPPAWWDPQENPPQITPYNFQLAMHDAMVKHMPGKQYSPSLAESYDIPPDFKSATFKLRAGIKFHDGSKVTPEDVKFTFENYRGANAKILQDKVDRIEAPDDRTVKFIFKEPFVDFMTLYGSPASGAGWIVPKAYYEKVGTDGFKNAPIGAGPYRFVKQTAGTDLEVEAFTEYWRKSPSIKTIVFKGIPETATRLALLKTGDVDAAYAIQGELFNTLRNDPTLRTVAIQGNPTWLEMTSLDRPDHPLKDLRVRQAVSLAIDRKAINEAELGGMSTIGGNWIPPDWPGAIEKPVPPTDIAQAKMLLADAGYPDGFEVSAITPLPPYFSWAERIATQLRAVGIKTQLNQMERGAFYDRMTPGPNRLKGLILMFSGQQGDAAARFRENAVTGGSFSGLSIPEIDSAMKQYDASIDLAERKKILDTLQNYILDQYILIPVCRNVAIWGFGSRAGGKLEDYCGAIPQYNFLGPYEDMTLKDS
jgi:peptide/nickel transport system substrate-binding protein